MKKKSVLIIGLGRFGVYIAEKLSDMGHEIMAVDRNEQRVNDALRFATDGQIGDATDEKFLKSLGVGNYDVCFVTIGRDFQSSLEVTSALKELGAKKVISRAERDGQAKFLLRNGADDIVYPEKQMATWAAVRFSADHILDYVEIDPSCSIMEIPVPTQWIGKSIRDLNVRTKYGVNIVAVKENGKVNGTVSPDETLAENSTLLVLGNNKDLNKILSL